MKLTTPVALPKKHLQARYGEKILCMGSCFSEHIGGLLQSRGYNIVINPFGPLYNPISIHKAIERLLTGSPYTKEDLFTHQGLYHSPDHHGRYSTPSAEDTLELINKALAQGIAQIRDLRYLILSFGTAYYYRSVETGNIVANCHKLPEKAFSRTRFDIDTYLEDWVNILNTLISLNPELKIINTISPIRHLRDGVHENQLSKSILMLFEERLRQLYPNQISYFPAYEILQDELRDYRYYADDLVHPSPLSIRIIGERFLPWFSCEDSLKLGEQVEKFRLQWLHRSLHLSKEDQIRRDKLKEEIASFSRAYPTLDLSSWYTD